MATAVAGQKWAEGMRSQLRFVMHPDDERDFISEVMREDAVVLINGPRWKSRIPEVHRNLDSIDWYCIIWSRHDLAQLEAEFIPKYNDWYCRSEGATIQFLRSRKNESVLVEGRLAVSTNAEPSEVAGAVERRYRNLRTFVKKRYRNGIVQWRNAILPKAGAAASRSSNPSKADTSLWIGPAAAQWLRQDPTMRKVKQDISAPVEAELTFDARDELAKECFRAMAREFMTANPSVAHEWRDVPSSLMGTRTDLVCSENTPREVWVTLRDDSIAVGTGSSHTDFEAFGRSVSPDQLAREAFAEFVRLLREKGHMGPQ